jgi:tetratricopeptide (TPR) repeat protein
MTLKEQLLHILERSRARELEFLNHLSDEERAIEGTFENWSGKDVVAHANYWEDIRATRSVGWIQREELDPIPPFDQANVTCYEQFFNQSWEEVEAFAKRTHERMVEVVRDMDEDALTGPSEESQERKMWDVLVGSAYTHKILHYAEFYEDHGRRDEAGALWNEWVELVSPLDPGPEWQGNVHYNAACSLALAGDREGALEALRKGLELRPSLKAWSRLDSDLELLQDHPEYRELFAPAFWWQAIEANPQAEALADQFVRALSMLRIAVDHFTEEEWRQGETNYQRPAGLALHIVQTIDLYSAFRPGERSEDRLTQINWEERDSPKLPSQTELLKYLDDAEERLATFLAKSDLQAEEEMFPWTGSTVLSRALYTLRHTQHHLADMAMELQRRGFKPPSWQ